MEANTMTLEHSFIVTIGWRSTNELGCTFIATQNDKAKELDQSEFNDQWDKADVHLLLTTNNQHQVYDVLTEVEKRNPDKWTITHLPEVFLILS